MGTIKSRIALVNCARPTNEDGSKISRSSPNILSSALGSTKTNGSGRVEYFLPANVFEEDRLTQQHYLMRAVTGRLHSGPINPLSKKILDIGTGTGIWCLEMAVDYPEYEILGIDVTPIQPRTVIPSNCSFQIMNALDGLHDLPRNHYDFIHQRLMLGAYTGDDWPKQTALLRDLCRPGGTVEMVESDSTTYNGGKWGNIVLQLVRDVCLSRNINLLNANRGVEYLTAAGFENITKTVFTFSFGDKHGNVGSLAAFDYVHLGMTFAPKIVAAGLLTQAEMDEAIEGWKQELEDPNDNTTANVYVFHATKPMA